MNVLRMHNDGMFRNATGTILFVKNFNKAFDIFNSKHINSNNLFKKGLNEENSEKIFQFLDYFSHYLKSIKLEGNSVLETARSTGFLGFLINIATLRFFYEEYVVTKKIENIFFYFFGQDMLEALFSRVRAALGSNNNPTAEQLSGVLRQLVIYNELTAPGSASCQDNLNILTVSSHATPQVTFLVQSIEIDEEEAQNIVLNYKDLYSIKLRAGTIEKKIRYGTSRCSHDARKNIFVNNCDRIDGIFYENGLAQKPTKSTVIICEIIYKYFMLSDIYNFDYNSFHRKILNIIPFENLYCDIDFSHNEHHKSGIILLIIDEYIRMHATYAARIATIQLHSKFFGKTALKIKQNLGQ